MAKGGNALHRQLSMQHRGGLSFTHRRPSLTPSNLHEINAKFTDRTYSVRRQSFRRAYRRARVRVTPAFACVCICVHINTCTDLYRGAIISLGNMLDPRSHEVSSYRTPIDTENRRKSKLLNSYIAIEAHDAF